MLGVVVSKKVLVVVIYFFALNRVVIYLSSLRPDWCAIGCSCACCHGGLPASVRSRKKDDACVKKKKSICDGTGVIISAQVYGGGCMLVWVIGRPIHCLCCMCSMYV